jgi:hypothetical protein
VGCLGRFQLAVVDRLARVISYFHGLGLSYCGVRFFGLSLGRTGDQFFRPTRLDHLVHKNWPSIHLRIDDPSDFFW